jgi:hypothetical protein
LRTAISPMTLEVSSKVSDGCVYKSMKSWANLLVGTGRFELPTPRTPSECSTRLSHVPTRRKPLLHRSGWGLTRGFYHQRGAFALLGEILASPLVIFSCASTCATRDWSRAAATELLPEPRIGFSSPPDRYDRPERESSAPCCKSCVSAGR